MVPHEEIVAAEEAAVNRVNGIQFGSSPGVVWVCRECREDGACIRVSGVFTSPVIGAR